MRLTAAWMVVALTAAAIALWRSGELGEEWPGGLLPGAALVLLLLGGVLAGWMRKRQRRRIQDTRHSALW